MSTALPDSVATGRSPEPIAMPRRARLGALRRRISLKRGLDLVITVPLLVAVAPVMVGIAVAIRLDSPGPILFRQQRIGHNRRGSRGTAPGRDRRARDAYGRPFTMYKFRTMRTDAPVYATSPASGCDPRITRVGRVLRATCLDELPQLLNVLRGDMSLVGPRPEMPFIVQTYRDRERRRLEVPPGITGPWQIEGPRDRAIHEALELDLEYIRRRSVAYDLRLLVRTLHFAVRRRNV